MGLFGAHATTRWWGVALFGKLDSFADASPLVVVFMAGWLILSVIGGAIIGLLIVEGCSARDRDRRQREEAEHRRQWEVEARERQRLRKIRDQLYLESLSAEERERTLARRRREQDLDQRAQAILDAERRGKADGR